MACVHVLPCVNGACHHWRRRSLLQVAALAPGALIAGCSAGGAYYRLQRRRRSLQVAAPGLPLLHGVEGWGGWGLNVFQCHFPPRLHLPLDVMIPLSPFSSIMLPKPLSDSHRRPSLGTIDHMPVHGIYVVANIIRSRHCNM